MRQLFCKIFLFLLRFKEVICNLTKHKRYILNIQALQEQQYQAVQRLSLQDIQRLRQIMFDNQELRMIKCDYNYCEETKEEEEETTAKTNVSKHNVSQNEYCQHNGCKKEYYQHSGCKNKYYQNDLYQNVRYLQWRKLFKL